MQQDYTLRVPLRDPELYSPKRMYPAQHHWLEVSCPRCSHIMKHGLDTPLFCYGNKEACFWCEECEYSTPKAFVRVGIIDDNMVIEKDDAFEGSITHCHFTRTEVKRLR